MILYNQGNSLVNIALPSRTVTVPPQGTVTLTQGEYFGLISSGAASTSGLVDVTNIEVSTVVVPTTGFNLTIPNFNRTFILNPAGTLASGTIVLPTLAFNNMDVWIHSTQIITSLTLQARSGQVLRNPPTTIAADGAIGYTFDNSTGSQIWFRKI